MHPIARHVFPALMIGLSAIASPASAQDAEAIRTAEQLRDRALAGSGAYAIVEEITTRFGPRPAGGASERAAAEWGVGYLRAQGFDDPRLQDFPLTAWTRGEESVAIVGRFAQPLAAVGLGGGLATPPDGVEGDAVVFDTWQALLDAPEGSLTGRIAVVLQDTVRAQDGRGYGSSSIMRTQGPTEAARRGAVGYLLRSLGTHDHRFPHTGATRVGEGTIPAFAVSPPDADQIRRLAALNEGPVRLRLRSTSAFEAPGRSQNVIAEVRGRERPDEIITIGGHLDSWDQGTGAIDDAAGVAITTAALKLIRDLPRAPRRTIRVVWWGAEEVSQPPPAQGLAGARAYADSIAGEVDRHVAISESDFGAGRIYGLSLPEGQAGTDFQKAAVRVLTPLGVLWNPAPARGGGPDTGPSVALGVPAFQLAQDGTDYFDFHHTADDVIDRIDPENLDQNVAAWAALLWLIAESDVDFRTAPATP